MNPHSRRGALGQRVTKTCVTDITSFLKRVASKQGVTNVGTGESNLKCKQCVIAVRVTGSVYKES